ncbi:MAG: nuclear transport factor 2 family protein [Cyclobacteriaceae bacterium]
MKTFFLMISLFFSFSAVGQTKEETEIMNLAKKKFRWMVEKKIDSLSALADERLSYIHSNGWIQTKKDFIEDFNGKLIFHDIQIVELHSRVYRRSAVVTGKGHFIVSLNGNRMEVDLLFTEVYIRSGGKWKLVSRHANRLG